MWLKYLQYFKLTAVLQEQYLKLVNICIYLKPMYQFCTKV